MKTIGKGILGGALAAVCATTATGQSSSLLMQAGAAVSSFDDLEAFDEGDWYALVDTSFVHPAHLELWHNGAPLLVQGAALSVPGAVLDDVDGQAPHQPFVDVNPAFACPQRNLGILCLTDDADPGTPPAVSAQNDRGLFLGTELVLREGSVTTAPEVPAGTIVRTLHRSCRNALGDALLLVDLADPSTGAEYAAVLKVDLDPVCSAPGGARQSIVFKNGDALANGDRMSGLAATEKHSFDLNARGDAMFIAAFDKPIDRRVLIGDRVVLRETQPIPGGLGAATSLQVAAVDINDLGDYVIQTRGSIGTCIVRGTVLHPNTQTKFVQTGEPVPDPDIGPYILRRIGASNRFANGAARNWAPVLITNSGDVVWYGEWQEPSGSGSVTQSAIFVNHKAVVRTGSIQAGAVIERIGSLDAELRYEFDVSPNGRYLVYEAAAGAPISQDGLFRMDLGESRPYGTTPEGCGYAYPPAGLEHVSDDGVPGAPVGFGGFPLRNGQSFYVRVDAPPPPAATSIALVFHGAPAANPCGSPFAGVQVLVAGPGLVTPLVQPVSQPIFPLAVPSSVAPGLVAHAQAFFLGPRGGILGATNGLRFVFGDP